MPYQKSLYNLLIPYPDGRTIIFNAFSGALGLFQPDTLQRYHENKLSAEEEQTLVKKGILIPEGTDEKSLISSRSRKRNPSQQGEANSPLDHFGLQCTLLLLL